MTATVLGFPDLLEARQNMTVPRYAAHRLHAQKDPMPFTVKQELLSNFAAVHLAAFGWVAIDSLGGIYSLDVIQTGPSEFEYNAMLAPALGSEGPQAA